MTFAGLVVSLAALLVFLIQRRRHPYWARPGHWYCRECGLQTLAGDMRACEVDMRIAAPRCTTCRQTLAKLIRHQENMERWRNAKPGELVPMRQL